MVDKVMDTKKDSVVVSPYMLDDGEMLHYEVMYCRCDVVVVHRIYNISLGSHDRGLEEHQEGLAGVLAGGLPDMSDVDKMLFKEVMY